MTSNRARKRAARDRAALTGERYVVARRQTAEPSATVEDNATERPYPWVIRVLHDLMHRVPGVPKHANPGYVRAEHEKRHRARAAEVRGAPPGASGEGKGPASR